LFFTFQALRCGKFNVGKASAGQGWFGFPGWKKRTNTRETNMSQDLAIEAQKESGNDLSLKRADSARTGLADEAIMELASQKCKWDKGRLVCQTKPDNYCKWVGNKLECGDYR
jgi:hypothetical protein